MNLGAVIAQLQANYQFEEKLIKRTAPELDEKVRESDWSGFIEYRLSREDFIRLSHRFSIRGDNELSQKSLYLYWNKDLPTFFDLDGNFEYSLKGQGLGAFRLGITFADKPRSCWELSVSLG